MSNSTKQLWRSLLCPAHIHHGLAAVLVVTLWLGTSKSANGQTFYWDGSANSWSSAHWLDSGALPIAGYPSGNATGVINTGSVDLDLDITLAQLTLGTAVVSGAHSLGTSGMFHWAGGQLSGGVNVTANGGMRIDNPMGNALVGASLKNASGSTATQSGGTFYLNDGGVFKNAGTFETQSGGMDASSGVGNSFENSGTFNCNSGSATYEIGFGVTFNNSGTVNANTLILQVDGPGTSSGAFNAPLGAQVLFGGEYTFGAGTSFGGAGKIIMYSGMKSVTGSIVSNVATLTLSGGLTISAGATLTQHGQLDLSYGGSLYGSGTIVVTGGLTIGAVLPQVIVGVTLTNATGSTAIHADTTPYAGFSLIDDAQFNNAGTFYARAAPGLTAGAGTNNAFHNSGTFISDGGGSGYLIDSGIEFDNSGTVTATSPYLGIRGTGTSTGAFNVALGSHVGFQGTYTFASGTTFQGQGSIDIAGQVTVGTSIVSEVGSLNMEGGTLNIPPDVTFVQQGILDFEGGGIVGGGSLIVSGGMTFGDLMRRSLGAITLVNSGNVNATISPAFPTLYLNNGATFKNAGSFTADNLWLNSDGANIKNAGSFTVDNLRFDSPSASATTWNNTGLLTATSATFGDPIRFDNSGTVTVRRGGNFTVNGVVAQFDGQTLSGGTWQIYADANLQIRPSSAQTGILTNLANVLMSGHYSNSYSSFSGIEQMTLNGGNFTVTDGRQFTTESDLTNTGTITVGPAANITVGGNYSQPSPGILLLQGGTFGATGTTTIKTGAKVNGFGTVSGTLTNEGTMNGTGAGTLTLTGNVINNGLIILAGGATLSATGASFVNNGTIDIITGHFTPTAGFINNGVILDSSAVRVKQSSKVGSTVTVVVDAFTGHTFQLQRSNSLASGTFANIGSPQSADTGTTLTFTDPQAPPDEGFYRVLVNP